MTDVSVKVNRLLSAVTGTASTNLYAESLSAVVAVSAKATFAYYANLNVVVTLQAKQALTYVNKILAVVKGRESQLEVRVWTFTLDGHDFYVLRLGDLETLVYDLLTEQWSVWDSHGLPYWRIFSGITWQGAQNLAQSFGSNILGGDDTKGLVWFLDPQQSFDQYPEVDSAIEKQSFTRVAVGQIGARGRKATPCYAAFINGDNYANKIIDASVSLKISDDAGKTYIDAGSLVFSPNGTYAWYSLGQISSPGRIFKIEDTGVMTRIDDMQMNDEAPT